MIHFSIFTSFQNNFPNNDRTKINTAESHYSPRTLLCWGLRSVWSASVCSGIVFLVCEGVKKLVCVCSIIVCSGIRVIASTEQHFLLNYLLARTSFMHVMHVPYTYSVRINFERKRSILSLKPPVKHLFSKYQNAPNSFILRFYKKSKKYASCSFWWGIQHRSRIWNRTLTANMSG